MKIDKVGLLLALVVLALAGCGGHKVLVSRGTTVPQDLQVMSEDQLLEYFKVKIEKGYKDGSSLTASVVMVDMAYLKATGQTMEATDLEMDALTKLKRFDVHMVYRTPMIVPTEGAAENMAMDLWSVTLRDSTGKTVSPQELNFETPLMEKEATSPEDFDIKSKLVLTYILKGNLIFEYQIPEGCKWVEIEFAPPQTGHRIVTRWVVLN